MELSCPRLGTIKHGISLEVRSHSFLQSYYVSTSTITLLTCSKADISIATVTIDTPAQNVYGFEVLLGIGSGAFVQAGYAVLFSILEPADLAFGTSFMMLGI